MSHKAQAYTSHPPTPAPTVSLLASPVPGEGWTVLVEGGHEQHTLLRLGLDGLVRPWVEGASFVPRSGS